jgi:putative ABC transport system permease protein
MDGVIAKKSRRYSKLLKMIRSYILTAFRALRKHRFYTFINISGLSVGIAACLVIMLFVVNEFSYDRYHRKGDRTHRLNTEIKFGTNHFHIATGYPVMAELFKQNYPEIESIVRITDWGKRYVRQVNGHEKTRENVVWADSTFFDVFSIPVLEGNPREALRQPNSIAISRKMARKYFPNGSGLGQSLILDDNSNYKVTAVYEDIPALSHFHFDILRAMAGLEDAKSVTLVGGSEAHIYLLLKEGTRVEQLKSKFPAFIQKYVMPQIADAVGGDQSLEKFRAAGNLWEYTLTNIKDIHLHSALLGEFEPNGDVTYVYLFSAIAIFILIIACINFMNLSTARSANRAREVGVRKVLGSLRAQLIKQFLAESFMLTLFSFGLALTIAYFFLPVFNTLADKQLVLPLHQLWFYGLLLVTSMFVALLAGLYPAFFLSAFKPAAVLKGKLSLGSKSGFVRSGLVVFQFAVSIFLIIATLAVNRQLNFIQNKRLGFEKDQLIVVKEAFSLGNNLLPFKEEALRNTSILSGTISGYLPVAGGWRSRDTYWNGEATPTQTNLQDMVNIQTWRIDLDYLKTFKMKMKYGRAFSPDFLSDSTAIILNETAIDRFKIEGDPIGKKVSHFGAQRPDGSPDPTKIESWTIVGVVKDFHFESLKNNIEPLGFLLHKSDGSVTFRFESAKTSEVIATLEKAWKKLAPDSPFQYSFLDEDFGKMYATEYRLGKIFALFALLAIVIACLGLFALTAFTAEQRTKEIGIRKALGASVNTIILLLSKDFSRLIFIAFVLAIPLAWYSVGRWLEGYAFKTDIGISVYAVAGGLTILISLATMSYQSIKAASGNPVESLRSE